MEAWELGVAFAGASCPAGMTDVGAAKGGASESWIVWERESLAQGMS